MSCGCEPVPVPIQFIVGTTVGGPITGTNYYYNPILFGKDYLIYRNIWGVLVPGTHYTISPMGGFILTSPDNFGAGEIFTITFY